MDIVTITDHDSIDGCLHFLNKYPEKHAEDFIIGKKLRPIFPSFPARFTSPSTVLMKPNTGRSPASRKLDELLPYLHSQGIIHVLNHLFHGFPKREHGRRFVEKMIESFDIFEGLNGCIGTRQNQLVAEVIQKFPTKAIVAGSDAHTLLRLGSCYTLCQSGNRAEFLASLRAGKVRISGKGGRFTHIFNDAMGVYLAYFRDIAFRNEVHREWSAVKKVRNGLGWAGYLPVFCTLSLAYAIIYYRVEDHRQPYYEGLFQEMLKA
jgi:hypothetical protein